MSTTRTAPVPDGHLTYRDEGDGDVVVLLHGGALDHRTWDDQVPAMAEHVRVVAPDARGHGRSSTPVAPFRHCDDVVALLDHLDVPSAVLVGLSMGAATATDTALEHPDRVRALVVSGAATSEPEFHDPFVLAMFAEWQAAEEARDADRWVRAFLTVAWGPHRSEADVDPAVLDRLREMALLTVTEHADGGRAHLQPVLRTWERLPQIAVPVLAVDGEVDSDDHLAMARRMLAAVPDGREVVVPDAAHYPNMERPRQFTDAVLELVSSLPAVTVRAGGR